MKKMGLIFCLCLIMASEVIAAKNPSFSCKGTKNGRFVIDKSMLKCDLRGKIVSDSDLKIPLAKKILINSDIHIPVKRGIILDLVQPGKRADEMIAQMPKVKFNGTIFLNCGNVELPFRFYLAPKYTLKGKSLCSSDLKVTEVKLNLSGLSISRISSVFDRLIEKFVNESNSVAKEAKRLSQESLSEVREFIGCF